MDGFVLTVALAKGRLGNKGLEILAQCGIEYFAEKDDRSLVAYDTSGRVRFLFVKPSDVPTYVERGTADIGIVGKDTVMEEGKEIYELLDLGFGACRLCIAGLPKIESALTNNNLRVGTKYPSIAKDYYLAKGIKADIIKLNGSVELAPVTDLSDVILDIVESGKTLKANGLVIMETVYDNISARLVANKVSLKTKHTVISPLLNKIEEVLKADGAR